MATLYRMPSSAARQNQPITDSQVSCKNLYQKVGDLQTYIQKNCKPEMN